MKSIPKKRMFILDTSVILSGKPINLDANMITTPGVAKEFSPGGRDYQNFQFLMEKGLTVHDPTKDSIKQINNISIKTGDKERLSETDKEILALALDLNKNDENEAIILTDDYSIQNVAQELKIKFEAISQRGITKKFKWIYRCSGCGKKFEENIKTCPICGASTRNIISHKENIAGKECDNR
ncbi:MAG: nucleic acid-binding protein [Euryarchaeota archaeon]|nr:nucleic acid-binding protein [Euryarchaeota archaeon]